MISGPPNRWCAGERVEQPVGADLGRIVDADVEAPVQRGAGDQRLDVEPVAAKAAQVIERGRHDGADHRGGDVVALEADMAEQGQQPDAVFVGGALRVGTDTPDAAPCGAVAHGEDDVGVAAVYDEQHGQVSP